MAGGAPAEVEFADAKAAPWLADAALATAALTLAQAGIDALRGA